MEELRLSDTELRYFGDLFLCCDTEKTGKISTLKATELFRSANLSNDIVKQIMSLVGIPQNSIHLSRKQFYACLKLIAAHQASIQLRQEMITTTATLPLPRFSWKDSPPPMSSAASVDSSILNDRHSNMSDGGDGGPGQQTPENSVRLIDSGTSDIVNSDQPSTDSEVEQTDTPRQHRGSPENWSTASDSPTPTNSAAERPWAKDTLWQGLLCEEQRQLLGTEEESSDRHSSDDDNDVDFETVYQITTEQREYYIKQFRAVQPDLNGLLAGHVARIFFEKSRIPIEELRHIWQLCDVTRDNALSLGEFTAAMHLIVLRRNNIPLPSVLPPCLLSTVNGIVVGNSIVEKTDPPEADLLNLGDDVDSKASTVSKISSPNSIISSSNLSNNNSNLTSSNNNSSISNNSSSLITTNTITTTNPPTTTEHVSPIKQIQSQNSSQIVDKEWSVANKQWTKFPESPTSSNVSSPGPKPLNFDMQRTAQAVVSDPQILHPVPLRVTPVGGALTTTTTAAVQMSTQQQQSMTGSITGPESIEDEILSGNRHYSRTKSNNNNNINNNNNNNNENLVYTDIGSRDINDSSPKQQQQPPAPPPPALQTVNLQQHRDSLPNDIRPIQRPQPKKLTQKNIGALPPPPQRETSITSLTVAEIGVGGTNGGVAAAATAQSLAGGGDNIGNHINQLANRKDPPPLPPPRPHRHGHARSSSLDLNKLKLNAPPEIPPRVSPQTSVDVQMAVENPSFADFAQFSEIEFQTGNDPNLQSKIIEHAAGAATIQGHPRPTIQSLQSSQRTSAFEVYRKPGTQNSQSPNNNGGSSVVVVAAGVVTPALSGIANLSSTTPSAMVPLSSSSSRSLEYEKRVATITDNLKYVTFKQDKNLNEILKHLKEQNSLLLKLCNDLSEELLVIQHKKEEIRTRLDHHHLHHHQHYAHLPQQIQSSSAGVGGPGGAATGGIGGGGGDTIV